MRIVIKGSSDYLYYAFNPYVEKDRFGLELENLALKFENRLRKRNKINFDKMVIVISTDTSLFSHIGARTKSYSHYIHE